ncbi:MAG: dual specificity protein phosphatase family protein [Flavobacteriales bacterium]|nr:dual specificity protein phosphatase family protein [Flavobacteriales bacterium]
MFTRVHWVYRSDVARIGIMARPRGHEWLDGELQRLREQGVEVLVSLLERAEMEALGLSQEAQLAKRHQVQFLLHPVVDRGVPSDRRDFMDFIAKVEANFREGKTVVVHCRMGIGRSSLTIAALLMRLGFDAAGAFELISGSRGMVVPDTEDQRQWLTTLY